MIRSSQAKTIERERERDVNGMGQEQYPSSCYMMERTLLNLFKSVNPFCFILTFFVLNKSNYNNIGDIYMNNGLDLKFLKSYTHGIDHIYAWN